MAQLTWVRRLKVSANVDVVARGGINDFLRPSALRASDELRHADFQPGGDERVRSSALLAAKRARYLQLPDVRAVRPYCIEPASKCGQAREPINREQVRVTATVGRPKTRDWRNTAKRRSRNGPSALQTGRVVGMPSTKNLCHLSEIVDVPVGAAHWLQVMFDPCSQTARAEGAAEVQIKR